MRILCLNRIKKMMNGALGWRKAKLSSIKMVSMRLKKLIAEKLGARNLIFAPSRLLEYDDVAN